MTLRLYCHSYLYVCYADLAWPARAGLKPFQRSCLAASASALRCSERKRSGGTGILACLVQQLSWMYGVVKLGVASEIAISKGALSDLALPATCRSEREVG